MEANGARLSDPLVTKLIVVVTDNPSANKSATRREAELLRDAGIGLVTIGVGTYLDRYELSAVASYPYTRNMFTINTVRNLTVFTDPIKRIICGGPFNTSALVHCFRDHGPFVYFQHHSMFRKRKLEYWRNFSRECVIV